MRYIDIKKGDSSISGNVKALVFLNIVLAFTALFKDILMAAYLGTTGEADALLLGYSITDIMGNSLFGAAVGASCIPALSWLRAKHDSLDFVKTIKKLLTYILVLSFILLAALYIFRRSVIGMLGRGFSPGIFYICIELFIIMLPTLILYPAAALGTSVMQVSGNFIIPAAAPVVFNGIFLAPLLAGYIFKIPVSAGVYLTGFSVTLGVFVMTLMIWYPIFRMRQGAGGAGAAGVQSSMEKVEYAALKKIFIIFIPYLIILVFNQGVLYVERFIASGMGEGSIAGLNYAYRLSQFPVWVFVAAVGAVVYPSMSKYIEEGDYERLKSVIVKALGMVLAITIPMSLFLLVFRVPVISVLFMRGAFDQNSLKITSDILFGYCFSIVGQSASVISLKALLSSGKIRYGLVVYLTSFIINVSLDFILVPAAGIKGIGYGAAAGAVLNGLLTYLVVRREFHVKPGWDARTIVGAAAANILTLVASVLLMKVWYSFIGHCSFLIQAGFVGISAVVCLAIYALVLRRAGLMRFGGV